jgi:hypothetical protein
LVKLIEPLSRIVIFALDEKFQKVVRY